MNAEHFDKLRKLVKEFMDSGLLIGVKPIVVSQLLDYIEQLELVEENLYNLHNAALEQIADLQAQLDSKEIELQHLKFDLLLPTQTQLAQSQIQRNEFVSIATELLNDLMNVAISNGANSRSMPDRYVEIALRISQLGGGSEIH